MLGGIFSVTHNKYLMHQANSRVQTLEAHATAGS